MAAGKERLLGKVAFISGGASGIGRATAAIFIEQGAKVVIGDLNQDLGRETASQISCDFVPLDVTDEDSWKAAVAKTMGDQGRLDVMVNNAGVGTGGDIETTTLASWRQIHAVNTEGVFLGCQQAVLAMKEAGNGGSIVNISSVAGIVGAPHLTAYCSSKGAVRMLTKSIALHCARKGYGIRCNSVHPSYTDTPMVDGMVDTHRDPERYRSALESASPLGRLGAPSDIAGAILYLASDDSAFVTGAELIVDGGVTAT